MSFNIITGTMGGGKSYFAAQQVKAALLKGRKVWTNLPLNLETFKTQNIPIEGVLHALPDDFSEWAEKIEHSKEGDENLVLVDEAGIYFFTTDKKNTGVKEELYKLIKYSRHFGLDIVFVEQALENLDTQLKRMAQTRIHCTAVNSIPLVGGLASIFWGDFKRGFYVPSKSTLLSATYHRFDSKVAALYRTDDKASAENKRTGTSKQKRKMTFTSWAIVALAFILPSAALYFGHSLYARFSTSPVKAEPAESLAINQPDSGKPQTARDFHVPPPAGVPFKSSDNIPNSESQDTFILIGGHPVKKDNFHDLLFVEPFSLRLHTDQGIVEVGGLVDGVPVMQIRKLTHNSFLVLDATPVWHFIRTNPKQTPTTQKSWATSSTTQAIPSLHTSPVGQSASPVPIQQPLSVKRVTPPAPQISSKYATSDEYNNSKEKWKYEHRGTDIIRRE